MSQLEQIAALSCLLCSRVVGTAQGTRQRITRVDVLRPEHRDAVIRWRCPYCGGRLWLGETQDAPPERKPLSPEDLRPKRGRPPKAESSPKARQKPSTPIRCVDCGDAVDERSTRCLPCQARSIAKWPKLAEILADGRPHRTDELRAALGVGPSSLRKYVQKLRREGHTIYSERVTYCISIYTLGDKDAPPPERPCNTCGVAPRARKRTECGTCRTRRWRERQRTRVAS